MDTGFSIRGALRLLALLVLAVALREILAAHHPSIEQVQDGNQTPLEHVLRYDRGHRISKKLRSKTSPAPELFSGWNCTPIMFFLRTAAVNSMP